MKKRSKNIDLSKMRKGPIVSSLLVAGAALTSVGCSCDDEEEKQKVTIVESVEDCVKETKLTKSECESARAKAIVAAEKSAPKFSDQKSCEEQFGYGRCNNGNNGIFMPLMTGFMIGNMMSGGSGTHHHYSPVYTSGTGSNTRYVGSSGTTIGSPGKSSYSVPTSTTRAQPRSTVSSTKSAYRARAAAKTTTTTSRSGWGSSGSAKSSGSSRSSWGS